MGMSDTIKKSMSRMNNKITMRIICLLLSLGSLFVANAQPRFHVLALYENGGHHVAYSKRAVEWLDRLAIDSNFTIDYIQSTDSITEKRLSDYQLFIQLDYPPYGWKPAAVRAFEDFVKQGKGGWIGFHHASLLGEFDGFPAWDWFIKFMGGIRFKDYIPGFADAMVHVEDHHHPLMTGLPDSFVIAKEEWYTYDRSPRKNVHVLARVDEESYQPSSPVTMGDHPVIWTNPLYKAKNVYIFMGHSPALFDDSNYTRLFSNAIWWAAATADDARPVIHVNQVGFDAAYPKNAVISSKDASLPGTRVSIIDLKTNRITRTLRIGTGMKVPGWDSLSFYYPIDISDIRSAGRYRLQFYYKEWQISSAPFLVGKDLLAKKTISSIVGYYRRQRANTPIELKTDSVMKLYGSDSTVDVHGGWCDASGDISKYLSHLAYANFFSPQQTPLVTWSLINTTDAIPTKLNEWGIMDSIRSEALWGADYLMRCLSADDYFYMTVFSYFNKDPNARRIVGLRANSVTTNEYQCSFREGGGMAIAALARIGRWNMHGDYTPAQYLAAARRAFSHLRQYNLAYDDDGKANIIDDYCALMAATELWISTGLDEYRIAARGYAANLQKRRTKDGWLISDDGHRPFFHAADAGLPVVAMARYLDMEKEPAYRKTALDFIQAVTAHQLCITKEVVNPFGYARQEFNLHDTLHHGFFIPHENETGWWWQGENARLGSLAAASLMAIRLQPDDRDNPGRKEFASNQLSWILGNNPYSMCFLYGFGLSNVPHMASMYGHGSEKGGISNGITGADGHADGSGIDFKKEAEGNEWRWTEQWIPHAAWFLQAITLLAEEK